MTTTSVPPPEPVEFSQPSWVGLRLLGLAGIAASLLVRVVEPSVVGVWAGIDDLVNAGRLAGAWLTQIFACGGAVAATVLALRIGRSPSSGRVRALAIGVGMMVVLSLVIASGALTEVVRRAFGERLLLRLPLESQLLLAASAALFSAAVAKDALTRQDLRAPALIAFGAAVVAAARTLNVATHSFLSVEGVRSVALASTGVASIEWAALAASSLLALAWLGTGRSSRLTLPDWLRRGAGTLLIAMAIVLASSATILSIRGQLVDASGWAAFFGRTVDRLLDPLALIVPQTLRLYVEWLRWAVALGALTFAPRGMSSSVAVGLLLAGCGEVTTPAGALALVLGAGCLVAASTRPAPPVGSDIESTVLAPPDAAD
jgi:hypothetical protein